MKQSGAKHLSNWILVPLEEDPSARCIRKGKQLWFFLEALVQKLCSFPTMLSVITTISYWDGVRDAERRKSTWTLLLSYAERSGETRSCFIAGFLLITRMFILLLTFLNVTESAMGYDSFLFDRYPVFMMRYDSVSYDSNSV